MRASLSAIALVAAAAPAAAERVLGAYLFVRHGDRVSKMTPPVYLTDLGYHEVFSTGQFYRNRYLGGGANAIAGVNADIATPEQLTATAPADAVLQNSATGFLQGIYPPAGSRAETKLRNGTEVQSPLGGYQLIAVATTQSGAGSEASTWIQSTTDCPPETVSSNNFFASNEYHELYDQSKSFYQSLAPMLNRTFSESDMTFKNAYTIYDYLNVANIHNSSNFPSANLLTNETYHRLLLLANAHEYGLAYNQSEPVRSVAGALVTGHALQALNKTVQSRGKTPLNFEFGSYASFMSTFGNLQLPKFSDDFTGMPDYASSLAFELITDKNGTDWPSTDDLKVRFMFHNGSITANDTDLQSFPLFGQSETELPWSTFYDKISNVSITNVDSWCKVCSGSSKCKSSSGGSAGAQSNSHSGHALSRPVAGVIGAMVTLGVILAVEALAMLAGGFRLTRKGAVTSVSKPASEITKV